MKNNSFGITSVYYRIVKIINFPPYTNFNILTLQTRIKRDNKVDCSYQKRIMRKKNVTIEQETLQLFAEITRL